MSKLDFAAIVREHSNRIYNTVYCILGNESDAEDVTQEVFLRAFRALPGFREKSSVSTWLHRIAINAASDFMKKDIRNTQLDERLDGGRLEMLVQALRNNGNPEVTYLNRELNEAIQRALMELPVKLRTVFILRVIEGYSYKEISDILEISIGTVESRLFRAREALKEILMSCPEKAGDSYEEL